MWLKRWRHTRGFGVHSPFAYRIIRDGIRLDKEYAYYADEEIARICRREGLSYHTERDACMFLHITALLNVRNAYISKNAPEPFLTAISRGGGDVRISHNKGDIQDCDLIAMHANGGIPLDELKEFILHPNKTLILKDCPDAMAEALYEVMQEGCMLRGSRNVILLSRLQMQKLIYYPLI